jgi:pimeloyl-ACP methyl ester carboxylesterase
MDNAPPRLRRAYFECRHGQLHVHNAIPVGGGFDELTTVICLHGASGTGRMFLEVSKQLGSSRSVYSPDLPGCGESDAAASRLSIGGYADAIADFLDSMRFRQVDLLGVGAGAAVAVELAVSRPKVVRKLYLLGVAGKETPAAGSGMQALQGAAAEWRADRRQLVKQPALANEGDTSAGTFESSAPALAARLADYFSAH